MTTQLVKCSSAQCSKRDFFPNQLTPVQAGDKTYNLCPDCHHALMADLSDRMLLRGMCKAVMTMGEIVRMRRERAQIYAGSQFSHSVEGWPVRLALPAPGVM